MIDGLVFPDVSLRFEIPPFRCAGVMCEPLLLGGSEWPYLGFVILSNFSRPCIERYNAACGRLHDSRWPLILRVKNGHHISPLQNIYLKKISPVLKLYTSQVAGSIPKPPNWGSMTPSQRRNWHQRLKSYHVGDTRRDFISSTPTTK